MAVIGTSVRRKDCDAKVTGAARYVDDLTFPGLIYARTIRSTVPRGRIDAIRLNFDPAGFTVVDYRDIPGRNVVAMIEDDQPCLAAHEVFHVAEPVLLLAHEDRERLSSADVGIDYTPQPALFDPERSTGCFKRIVIEKGSVNEGLRAADIVVEGEYRTGHQEQLYIEPNGMIAVPAGGGITVYGSMQCPYYVHRALMVVLGLDAAQVRVVQAETGGGFGGKEEFPSHIACHAALLARKAQRPVKLIYGRSEDMLATTKRHPATVRHRTGVMRDGRLVAMDIEVLLDGGAYCTLSPVVLSRGMIHASGPYRCPNVSIRGRVMRTHTPPNGAFRGFGAPQTQFAVEVHMDRLAVALGIDPLTLRATNAYVPGDVTATGQILPSDTSALDVLRTAATRTGYRRKRKAWQGTDRGVGLSLFFHGSGFTGAGEVRLASKVALELTATGARIRVASTEIGQGTRTMHAQIVADALGVPYECVEIAPADTTVVPDSGPTVASRTCMVVGGLLERAATRMRGRLNGATPAEYFRAHGAITESAEYERPAGLEWDEHRYHGDAYATYSWGCNVVELQIDRGTWEVTPLKTTAVVDIGRAIHPVMARGQVEGGTAQGLSWALLEQVVMRDGRMVNPTLTDYLIPTTLDTPPIDVVLLEHRYAHGPSGAKGVGEMPIDGPAPAVVNALRHAGYDVRSIPATPERLMVASRVEPRTKN